MSTKPIGVFDSGIGGLTVARRLVEVLPYEPLIYVGDTARVPYGSRGSETITQLALEMVDFLLGMDVKALVVACNTISAVCLDRIQSLSPVPVIGVIAPAALRIAHTTRTKRVGVIGTRATISSGRYQVEIAKIDPTIQVLAQACPLFVPVVEEGMANSQVARLLAHDYLSLFAGTDLDTLHLGCTHYPLLREVIQEVVGDHITVIDSAEPTVEELARLLFEQGLLSDEAMPDHQFYVTDDPARVAEVAGQFFGRDLSSRIEKIDIHSAVSVA